MNVEVQDEDDDPIGFGIPRRKPEGQLYDPKTQTYRYPTESERAEHQADVEQHMDRDHARRFLKVQSPANGSDLSQASFEDAVVEIGCDPSKATIICGVASFQYAKVIADFYRPEAPCVAVVPAGILTSPDSWFVVGPKCPAA